MVEARARAKAEEIFAQNNKDKVSAKLREACEKRGRAVWLMSAVENLNRVVDDNKNCRKRQGPRREGSK